MLTGHRERDRNQGAGDVQRESCAVEDEGIKDDSERFPAANNAERDQSDNEIHRHGSLQVHSDKQKREQEAGGNLKRYLEDQVYEEERVDRVCSVRIIL